MAEHTTFRGHEAIRLQAGDLAAVFLPRLGMVGASLEHEGEELLGRVDELEAYATKGSVVGIPILHPWANRLAGLAYRVGEREVELDSSSPLLHRDGNGRPIHGVLAASRWWEPAVRAKSSVAAELDYGAHPDLLAAFPFPHRLRLDVSLDKSGLTIATTLTPTTDVTVPAAFGFHPYLRLPGIARAAWHVELPAMRRLVLDGRQIPTGEEESFARSPGPLGDDVFDDGFAGVADGAAFVLAGGGRRVEVTFLEGYPYAQVYAPAGLDVVCFEPMTAPTNALVSGDGLRLVPPGHSLVGAFRIAVGPDDRPL
jgi:galactose mutarotase-like enzyme